MERKKIKKTVILILTPTFTHFLQKEMEEKLAQRTAGKGGGGGKGGKGGGGKKGR